MALNFSFTYYRTHAVSSGLWIFIIRYLRHSALMFLSFLLLTLYTANISYAEIVDMIAARINDEVILLSDVRMKIKQIAGIVDTGNLGQSEDMEDKVLKEMINERLILQYAKSRKYEIPDEEVIKMLAVIKKDNNLTEKQLEEMIKNEGLSMDNYKKMLKEQRMLINIMNAEINAKVNIDDADLNRYYEKNKEEFMTPAEVRVRHILILANEDNLPGKKIQAKNKAEDILNRIKAGENFEKLAKLYSEDGSGASGGDLGFFTRGKMIKEFDDAAFNLSPGELSEVVKTGFGYHIIKCEEKRPPVPKDFKDVSPEIEKKLFIEKANARRDIFLNQLKKNAIIERHI